MTTPTLCAFSTPAAVPSSDAKVLAIRHKQVKNLLATMFLSQGTPMLVAGDELGRTQRGNNNAYCQDNEISWLDWGNIDDSLIEFVRALIDIRPVQELVAVPCRADPQVRWER